MSDEIIEEKLENEKVAGKKDNLFSNMKDKIESEETKEKVDNLKKTVNKGTAEAKNKLNKELESLKNCSECGEEIGFKTKICPHCETRQEEKMKKIKNYAKVSILILGVLWLLLIFSATGQDKYIKLVKHGTMNEYATTTIGKAFGGTFKNSEWNSFETDKGVKVVEFEGMITKSFHDRFLEIKSIENPAYDLFLSEKDKDELLPVNDKIKVQWKIHSDGKSFEMGFFGLSNSEQGFDFNSINTSLSIIYN